MIKAMSKAPKNNWYVITGAPSSGKSTLIEELKKRGYHVSKDVARSLIDEKLASGVSLKRLRGDNERFQLEILHRKVAIEDRMDASQVTFFDCGLHDSIGFFNLHGIKIKKETKEILSSARYRRIFLLEPLDKYTRDYARIESQQQAGLLHELLYEAYVQAGMEPVLIPPVSPKKRADMVIEQIT